jgi:hypothetical protein
MPPARRGEPPRHMEPNNRLGRRPVPTAPRIRRCDPQDPDERPPDAYARKPRPIVRVLGSLCLFTCQRSASDHPEGRKTPRRTLPCRQEEGGSWQGNGNRISRRRRRRRAKADRSINRPTGMTWWRRTGSNRRPHACKARALPTELRPRGRLRRSRGRYDALPRFALHERKTRPRPVPLGQDVHTRPGGQCKPI